MRILKNYWVNLILKVLYSIGILKISIEMINLYRSNHIDIFVLVLVLTSFIIISVEIITKDLYYDKHQ